MAYLAQHRNVLLISRWPIILAEFYAVPPSSPTFFDKSKNKYFRSNGVNLVNDCNQQKINDTQGWEGGELIVQFLLCGRSWNKLGNI